MSAPEKFGVLLRELRHRTGLTQKELADLAGLSIRAVRDLERGRVSRPRKETVRLLADALRLRDGRRAVFLAAAAARFISGEEPVPRPARDDALEELRSPQGRERTDTDVYALAELLVTERRRLTAATEKAADGHGEIVFVATRSADSALNWSVFWAAQPM
ncbi:MULTISPECIES: helix-turn-helix domain-containing protein [Streptomyces]|uniref:Helix-turn-helix domain-containing protein n=1 Tax=Streptomyces heliomycini TaxID=284032 RepID=A0ABV5L816_9ACTN|nr:XRE family transcriptional regulator [Streptomyces sp. XY152]